MTIETEKKKKNRFLTKEFLFYAFLFALGVILLSVSVFAESINIGANLNVTEEATSVYNIDKGTYYDTIQQAIDDANYRDTIQLLDDEYNENVNIGIPLILEGNGATIYGVENDVDIINVQPKLYNKLLTTDNLWYSPTLSSGYDGGECDDHPEWDSGTTYSLNEWVSYNHILYRSLINNNNEHPSNESAWNNQYSCGYSIEAILESSPYDNQVYWYGNANQNNIIIGKDFGEDVLINSFRISSIDTTGSPNFVIVEGSHDNSTWDFVYESSLSYPRYGSSNNPVLPEDQIEERTWVGDEEYRYWRLRFTQQQSGSSFMRLNEVRFNRWDVLNYTKNGLSNIIFPPTNNQLFSLGVEGDVLVTAQTSNGGFTAVDISNPESPVVTFNQLFNAGGVDIEDGLAYVTDYGNNLLRIYDVSDIYNVVNVANYTMSCNNSMSVAINVYDGYAYVQDYSGANFGIVDVRDYNNIQCQGGLQIKTAYGGAISVIDNVMFVLAENGVLYVYDVTTKSSPSLLNQYDWNGNPMTTGIDVDENNIFVSNYGNNSLDILNNPCSDFTNPVCEDDIEIVSSLYQTKGDRARGLKYNAEEELVYVAWHRFFGTGNGATSVVDVSDRSNPEELAWYGVWSSVNAVDFKDKYIFSAPNTGRINVHYYDRDIVALRIKNLILDHKNMSSTEQFGSVYGVRASWVYNISLENIIVQNLGNDNQYERMGFNVQQTKFFTMRDCEVYNVRGNFAGGLRLGANVNADIDGLKVDGVIGTANEWLVYANGVNNATFRNMEIHNVQGSVPMPIQLQSSHNNYFENITMTNVTGSSSATFIKGQQSDNNTFRNVYLDGLYANGLIASAIDFTHDTNPELGNQNNVFENIIIRNLEGAVQTRGVNLDRGAKNNIFSNITMENFVGNANGMTASTLMGISVNSRAGNGNTINNLFEDITFRNFSSTGNVYGVNINSLTTSANTTNNTFRNLNFENSVIGDEVVGVRDTSNCNNVIEDSLFEGFDTALYGGETNCFIPTNNILLNNDIHLVNIINVSSRFDNNYVDFFASANDGLNAYGNMRFTFDNLFGLGDPLRAVSLHNLTLKIRENQKITSVEIPFNTTLTHPNNFDSENMTFEFENSIFTIQGKNSLSAIKFGHNDLETNFDKPITINMYVSANNGSELKIYRSQNGISWTNDGINNETCIVQNNVCSFNTTKASLFALTEIPTQPTGGSGGDPNKFVGEEEIEKVEIGIREPTNFFSVITGAEEFSGSSMIQLDTFKREVVMVEGTTQEFKVSLYNIAPHRNDVTLTILPKGKYEWFSTINPEVIIPARDDRDMVVKISVPDGTPQGKYSGFIDIQTEYEIGEFEFVVNVVPKKMSLWLLVLIVSVVSILFLIIAVKLSGTKKWKSL